MIVQHSIKVYSLGLLKTNFVEHKMFTCGNKALVVGMKFGFPTKNVKFNDALSTYDCNAAGIFKGLQQNSSCSKKRLESKRVISTCFTKLQ